MACKGVRSSVLFVRSFMSEYKLPFWYFMGTRPYLGTQSRRRVFLGTHVDEAWEIHFVNSRGCSVKRSCDLYGLLQPGFPYPSVIYRLCEGMHLEEQIQAPKLGDMLLASHAVTYFQ